MAMELGLCDVAFATLATDELEQCGRRVRYTCTAGAVAHWCLGLSLNLIILPRQRTSGDRTIDANEQHTYPLIVNLATRFRLRRRLRCLDRNGGASATRTRSGWHKHQGAIAAAASTGPAGQHSAEKVGPQSRPLRHY